MNSKLKITMISSLPPITGLSPYTKALVEVLEKRIGIHFLGFNHIYPRRLYPGVLYDESSPLLTDTENLKIHNVLNWFNPIGWIIEAFRIQTHIIHAQWWSYPLAPIYFCILGINKLRGKKIIITIHNVKPHERNFFKALFNRSIFYLGDEFIVHTLNNREELQKIIRNKKIHIIPHGLIKNPEIGISKDTARSKLNLSQKDKILLCFGHIRDYKGLDVAIKALAHIKNEHIKLMIAGKCWEDWEKYNQLIEKLSLAQRIILKIGFIPTDTIETLFKASDLILIPYKHFDSQSGVGALVIPFKIPFIVSNTGGLPEYVQDDRCIVTPGDDQDLASKIETILNDQQLYNKLISDIENIEGRFEMENIAQKTLNVYQA